MYKTLFEDALLIAKQGGKKTLEYFRAPIAIEEKEDNTPVTVADRETERLIRRLIEERYPNHDIIGEEFGGEVGRSEWEWIVDPIDGTKSFIRGVPLYTTLVAVIHKGQPVVGVIHAPVTGEIAAAVADGGAYDENGASITVSRCTALEDAWFCTTDPHDLVCHYPDEGIKLLKKCGAVRTWADAYGYLLLARSNVDLMIDPIMSPWDIAPLSVIVREAGGVFSSITGHTDDLGGSAIAAATADLHAQTLQIFTDGRSSL